jgi:WD40 repeat protein
MPAKKRPAPPILETRWHLQTLRSNGAPCGVYSAEPWPGGKEVLVCGYPGVWSIDVATGKETRRYQADEGYVCWTARVTRDGKRVFAPFGRCMMRGWNAKTMERVLEVPTTLIGTRLHLSADGKLGATAAGNTRLEVWDLRRGKSVAALPEKKSFALACALTPDGTLVARGGTDGVVRAHDVASQREVWSGKGDGWIEDMDASGDGSYFASGGRAKTVVLWDAKKGRKLRTFELGARVTALALSPGGHHVAATSTKGMPVVWDTETGETVGVVGGHEKGGIGALRFSHEGDALVSCDNWGRVQAVSLP